MPELGGGESLGAGGISSDTLAQAGPGIWCCTVPALGLGAASALLCWG